MAAAGATTRTGPGWCGRSASRERRVGIYDMKRMKGAGSFQLELDSTEMECLYYMLPGSYLSIET